MQRRPNIIWMFADDAGMPDFGCYGHPGIATPNIDRLAGEGLRFTHAFVTAPQCSPSRSSIYSGLYAHATGTEDLHSALPADAPFIPEMLGRAGYFTGAVGKLHLGKPARERFHFARPWPRDWPAFMRERPAGRPFFLSIGFLEPHRPYQFTGQIPQYRPRDVRVPAYLPDTLRVRIDLARYYTAITRLDAKVGEVLEFLDAAGLADDTLVIFSSDHGQPFPGAKGTLYDPGVRVPLVMRHPARLPTGVRHGLVSLLDLGPTTLEAAGVDIPGRLHGESHWPALPERTFSGRERVFIERNWHDVDDHVRGVRTRRFKYIHNAYFGEPHALPADVNASPSTRAIRRVARRSGLDDAQARILRTRPEQELYDLEADPWEAHNVADRPEHAATLARLRAAVQDWSRATDDVSPDHRRRRRFAYRLG